MRVTWLATSVLVAALGVAGYVTWRAARSSASATNSSDMPVPPELSAVRVLERRALGADDPPKVAPRVVREGTPAAELNRRAIAELEERHFDAAVGLFEQCLELAPDEPIFRSNLAEALLRRALDEHERVRPCSDCLAWLERAVELAPDRAGLKELLQRWQTEAAAEAGFMRDHSVHFALGYDGERGELLDSAPDVLEMLEHHYIDLAELFGVHPGERDRPRIPVVLYRVQEFTAITGLDWAGGSYDGTIRVPIADGRGLDAGLSALLRHELVHAFVRELGGRSVPAWLNEGVAQWFQLDPRTELELARSAVRERPLIEWAALVSPFSALGSPERIAVAYAQSLLACEFLERNFGREALVRAIAGCEANGGAAGAFEAWTRVSLSQALADFAAELERSR